MLYPTHSYRSSRPTPICFVFFFFNFGSYSVGFKVHSWLHTQRSHLSYSWTIWDAKKLGWASCKKSPLSTLYPSSHPFFQYTVDADWIRSNPNPVFVHCILIYTIYDIICQTYPLDFYPIIVIWDTYVLWLCVKISLLGAWEIVQRLRHVTNPS